MTKCSFCREKCDSNLILRDTHIAMKDGSDMIVCNTCLNLYTHHEYDELIKRIERGL